MNTLVLEIGNYNIRAALHDGRSVNLIPIGSYNSPYTISSVCTKLQNEQFVWGDMALYWKFHDGCLSYSLKELEKQPIYELAISSLISHILTYVTNVTSIVYIIPAYWSDKDPRKEILERAAQNNKLSVNIFVSTPVAVCYKVANLADQEYILFYDAGYSGVTLSLLQRQGDNISVIDSVFLENGGGVHYDQLLLSKINDKFILSIDVFDYLDYQSLYSTLLVNKATFIKETLSQKSECQIPVDRGKRIFKISSSDFHNWIAPSLGKTFQACCQILHDNHVKEENLQKIYLFGGSSRITCLQHDLTTYAKTQFNNSIQIINLLEVNKDGQFLPLLGASMISKRNTNNVLKFS